MIRSLYLATLVALLTSVATIASAQVTLKYKFPDGRKSTSEAKVTTAQTLTLAGMEIVSGSEQLLTFTSTKGNGPLTACSP